MTTHKISFTEDRVRSYIGFLDDHNMSPLDPIRPDGCHSIGHFDRILYSDAYPTIRFGDYVEDQDTSRQWKVSNEIYIFSHTKILILKLINS